MSNPELRIAFEPSAQLAGLAPFERDALLVLAAASAPIHRKEWMQQLRSLGVRRPSTTSMGGTLQISTGDLGELLKRVAGQGLVVESPPGSYAYCCTPTAKHELLDDADARDLLERLRAELSPVARPNMYGSLFDAASTLQAVRLALYCRAPAEAVALFEKVKRARPTDREAAIYRSLLDPRSPTAALELMPPELKTDYANHILSECLPRLCLPGPAMLAALVTLATDAAQRSAAVMAAAMSGDTGAADVWLDGDVSALGLEARAILALQRAQVDEARRLAAQAWQLSAEGLKGKRAKPQLRSLLAPLLTLLLATGEGEYVALARAQIERVTVKQRVPAGYGAIAVFLKCGELSARSNFPPELSDDLEWLIAALVTLFLDGAPQRALCSELQRRFAGYRALGAHWLAAEAEGVLARLGFETLPPPAADPPISNRAVLVDLFKPAPPWERSLSLLEALAPTERQASPADVDTQTADLRLVFLVRIVARDVTTSHQQAGLEEGDFVDSDEVPSLSAEPAVVSGKDPRASHTWSQLDRVFENRLAIEPRLQTRRGTGFTTGRAVALKTLFEGKGESTHLSAEDRRVIACIQSQKRYWGGRDYLFSARAPLALVDHPHVFWVDRPEGPAVPVVKHAPRLCARRGEGGFYLRVEPFANAAGVGVMSDAEGRLLVTELSAPQLNVQRTIAQLPPIPAQGEGRLREVLGRLSTLFTVESQVGVDAVDRVSPDSRIVVQLTRAEPGLRVRVCVAPLGLLGPRFAPGLGSATVAAEIEGKRLSCERDLTSETRALAVLVDVAPVLSDAHEGSATGVDSLQACLDLLHGLSSLQEAIVVEWPAGSPLVVAGTADLSSLRLTLGEETGWLSATGTLAVEEGRVLELMDVLARRTSDGAFVKIGEDRFVALSSELQEGLAALEAAASGDDNAAARALRVAPIALGFVSPWLRKLREVGGLTTPKRLAKQLARIEQAYDATYNVPQTFQAELRPYQIAGFEFLARLGQLGAGACLADDMGLGKTLMTLALLVARAGEGPAVIVAPTSVRANWFDEALRFAPTLRMLRVEDLERSELASLQAYDVVVMSYTLMAQRIEQIERVRFSTAVLDEAQSIKNAATQRARAACRVVADARVALTGTPVENHLGDLYGIMNFLNPSLLGDAKAFETRFAKPIQRDRDARARAHLRMLIAPFVLRRRKSEVLRELPPRTEITLRVEPEADERAFSEALRRAALQRLTGSGEDTLARSTVSILAEITRLRRAACHPQLVDPSVNVGAAKLECLVELVRELKEGAHRALIFSQFVDFLKLARVRLEAEDTQCMYLDGSTPENARRRAVAEFQSGQGDVFLISLKAGGFGLNLTAADYVIHLDPWWNPAVEAQASDRAHRIGQQRPVTIYRLVNAASIEERVLSLHERKQALAEEILSDSAEATRLDPNALLALLAD